jgi:hypothetical protein
MNNAVICVIVLIFTVIVNVGYNQYDFMSLKTLKGMRFYPKTVGPYQKMRQDSAFGTSNSMRRRNEPMHKMMHVDGFTTAIFNNKVSVTSDQDPTWYALFVHIFISYVLFVHGILYRILLVKNTGFSPY